MAISGVIDTIYRVDEGIKLDLMPYKDDPTGQRYLTIVEPTWIPPIGSIVGGASEHIIIYEGDGERWYYRPGYSTLYENFHHADVTAWAYWYQYGRQRGEAHP